jgi:hypothetical protein
MGTTKLCKASKSDASKCEVVDKGLRVCFFHDPSRAADRKVARSLGGHSNRMKTLDPGVPDFKIQNSGDTIALLA